MCVCKYIYTVLKLIMASIAATYSFFTYMFALMI